VSNAFDLSQPVSTLQKPTVTTCLATVGDANHGASAGGTAVTIVGTGFDIGTPTVAIGGAAATSVVVVNATHITCVTPAGTPEASVAVVVSGPGGAGTGTGTGTGGWLYDAAP
jgi:hypothetical protein